MTLSSKNGFRAAYDPRMNAFVGRAAMLIGEFKKAARRNGAASEKRRNELTRLLGEKSGLIEEARALARELGVRPERMTVCIRRLEEAAVAAVVAHNTEDDL